MGNMPEEVLIVFFSFDCIENQKENISVLGGEMAEIRILKFHQEPQMKAFYVFNIYLQMQH